LFRLFQQGKSVNLKKPGVESVTTNNNLTIDEAGKRLIPYILQGFREAFPSYSGKPESI
jgi:hypothetical protein